MYVSFGICSSASCVRHQRRSILNFWEQLYRPVLYRQKPLSIAVWRWAVDGGCDRVRNGDFWSGFSAPLHLLCFVSPASASAVLVDGEQAHGGGRDVCGAAAVFWPDRCRSTLHPPLATRTSAGCSASGRSGGGSGGG